LDLGRNIDYHIPQKQLFLTTDGLITDVFNNDEDIASISWVRNAKKQDEGFAYSLFFAHLYEPYQNLKVKGYRQFFPRGLPSVSSDNYYLLEQAVDWLGDELINAPQPFISYFHLMPPHAPYKTPLEFYDYFTGDGMRFTPKPFDIFASEKDSSYDRLWKLRTVYDEFIPYADREFGRFFDNLEKAGLLENTWVVLTSDHGEMFERGIPKHSTPVLYEPVIRIPLMIFEPGRKSRTDIFSNTSAVDILPTLLHVTGQKPAAWTEGVVLPPFGPEPDLNRNVHTIQAKLNKQYTPIEIATITLIKGRYKLQYFFGYDELGGPGSERIELYDLKNDPEELDNLYTVKRETATDLLGELKKKISEADKPYESNGLKNPVSVGHMG
jgi:arylsulfatase A-like enzyme